MRIVHLSDFHLNYNQLIDFNEFTMKALLKDLEEFNEEKKVDLILFSGDLIDQGGYSFEKDIDYGFLSFEEYVIMPILKKLNLPKDRFLFVPGNHDINRNTVDKIYEAGLLQSLNSITSVNDYIEEHLTKCVERVAAFKTFEKTYYAGLGHDISNFSSNFKYSIDGKKVGVSCFNSSWRCYDSNCDKERILVGERQIILARQAISDCDVKIAVMHHPFDWLAPFERKTIENLVTKDYDLMFCGHVHEGDLLSKSSMLGNLFISTAPSNWTVNIRSTNRNFSNGYTVVDYTEKNIISYNRRYNHPKECFDPNPDMGDKDGKQVTPIPNIKDISKHRLEKVICENIKKVHFSSRDEHLLTYKTDTLAPKSIEELFVLPHLVRNKQYDSDKLDKERLYNIEDICGSDKNILLTGNRESGKTVLLDRLLIEYVNKIEIYRKIPVYIDLEESKSSRLETDISRFLNIGIHEVESLLKDHNVILLIDNLTPVYNRHFKLKEIEKITRDFPNLRVITTCCTLIDGNFPLDLLDFNDISQFVRIKISPFKTKQIKSLAQKWFSKNIQIRKNDNTEDILKIFGKLNIPRTPLAVSMFLWIIEYQENYKPVNNASMLENFIERLFRKHSNKEVYSEEFDFTNKQRLLADIAYKMFQLNLENYKISSKELYSYIFDYLKARKFLFRVDDVLQEFLKAGVLLEENGENELFVRFRFNCFFKYFLMKNMDFKPEFKDFVLSENNYLMFEEEIDYFTGLRRDQDQILDLLVNRMNSDFEELVNYFKSKAGSFDMAFQISHSVINLLENNFLNELTNSDKPTEAEMDNLKDEVLDRNKDENGIEKKVELSKIQKLERSWTLTAKVLKNTEETEDGELKSSSYNDLITCSSAFATLYKIILKEHFEKRVEAINEKDEHLDIIYKVLPLAHQEVTYSLVGTAKLSIVMREDIENKIMKNPSLFTEFEKFVSVFIYSDLKGTNFLKYIAQLIKETKNTYINDMILFKLVTYYYFRSKSEAMDIEYLNLIGDLIVKVKGDPKISKSKIFEDYRRKKIKQIKTYDVDEAVI